MNAVGVAQADGAQAGDRSGRKRIAVVVRADGCGWFRWLTKEGLSKQEKEARNQKPDCMAKASTGAAHLAHMLGP
jgi:hypothetical protein